MDHKRAGKQFRLLGPDTACKLRVHAAWQKQATFLLVLGDALNLVADPVYNMVCEWGGHY